MPARSGYTPKKRGKIYTAFVLNNLDQQARRDAGTAGYQNRKLAN